MIRRGYQRFFMCMSPLCHVYMPSVCISFCVYVFPYRYPLVLKFPPCHVYVASIWYVLPYMYTGEEHTHQKTYTRKDYLRVDGKYTRTNIPHNEVYTRLPSLFATSLELERPTQSGQPKRPTHGYRLRARISEQTSQSHHVRVTD